MFSDQIKRAELNRLLHETKRLVCMSCKIVNARSISDLVGHIVDHNQVENYQKLFQKNITEDRKKLKENLTTLKEENIIRKGLLIVYHTCSELTKFQP